MGERRESKKRETRQRISDVATTLFFARGFEAVTLDEIAVAAGVAKQTVTNYFARKEELILDREDDLLLLPFRAALRDRAKGQPPIDALRRLVVQLTAEGHPLTRIDAQTNQWWRVVAASPALRARMRELAEEAAEGLAAALAGRAPDGFARLQAGMIVLTLRTAHAEAMQMFEHGASSKKATATLRALIEHGFAAVEQMAGR